MLRSFKRMFGLLFFCISLISLVKADVTIIEEPTITLTTNSEIPFIIHTHYRIDNRVEIFEIQKSPTKPTLIFFGGQDERTSVYRTQNVLNCNEPDEWNILFCALYEPKTSSTNEWKKCINSVVEFIEEQINEGLLSEPFSVDGYSYGGSGAFWLSEALIQDDINVNELTWIDATVSQVTKSDIEKLLNEGVKVNLFAGKGSRKISVRGREMISQLSGEVNFYGKVIDHGHENSIVDYVYKLYHLHEKFNLI